MDMSFQSQGFFINRGESLSNIRFRDILRSCFLAGPAGAIDLPLANQFLEVNHDMGSAADRFVWGCTIALFSIQQF
ncbi:hypothetical protein BST81_24545 [Leptolyngbya sp. 'hensonii']|nr:hypothetical protein BST81_24545 [Leptolyngbya sp. 'hensonii']